RRDLIGVGGSIDRCRRASGASLAGSYEDTCAQVRGEYETVSSGRTPMSTVIDSSEQNAIISEHRQAPSSPKVHASVASLVATAALLALLLPARPVRADSDPGGPFLPLQVSTVPSNGDLNPYGLAFVPSDFGSEGKLKAGEMLISNFNDTSL